MALPLKPPFPPMEALLVEEIPAGAEWQYEPKWDGFRTLAFREASKAEQQALRRVGAARARACRRGAVRSLHRQSVQARHKIFALEAGQGAHGLSLGAGQAFGTSVTPKIFGTMKDKS